MQQIDFGTGRISRSIAQTAFPMLVAHLLSLLYSIVDRVYIGHIPGEGTSALSGIGLCFPVIMIVLAFTNMFGVGGSPLFAIARGQGDRERAHDLMNTAFRLLALVGAVITLLGEALARPLLSLFGARGEAMDYALPYLRIYLLGTIPAMVSTGMNPFINAEGFPRAGMFTVVIGAVANLVLDPVFIFLLHMNAVGAALATILSQSLSALFVLRFLTGGRTEYRLRSLRAKSHAGPWAPYAGEIAALGTAPFIMQFTNSLVQIACNNVLMTFGGAVYVSVMTIVSSVRQILDVPASSITDGSMPIIAYNYGAGKRQRVMDTIRIMTIVGVVYTLVIQALIEWKPALFISIFSRDPDILKLAAPALHWYFFAFVFQALQYSGQTVFKSLRKTKQAVFFSLFRKVIMVVPLTLILPRVGGLGVMGVFIAEPISNTVGGLACYITMLFTVRKEMKAAGSGGR